MIEGTFGVVLVSADGATSTTIFMANADLTSLEIVKDEFNNEYLTGNVTLIGNDFNTVLHERINRDKSQLTVVYGDYTGVMKTDGEYHYDRRVCTLEVGDPEQFESIINLEFGPNNTNLSFDYDSYIYNVWGEGSFLQYYTNFSSCGANPNPPDWVSGKIYNGLTEYANGSKAGDSDVAVYHDSKKWLSITPGNDSEPGVGDGVFRWLEITAMTTIGQERSEYKFSDDAIYNKLLKYWYFEGCAIGTYTARVIGFNIKFNLQTQLQAYGYDLADDWLVYPKSINSAYENRLFLASTEVKTKTTIFELIEIIQQAFNCVYVVKDGLLKFIWEGDRYDDWNIFLPKQEHNLESVDIYDWNDSSNKSVKRHVLKFTDSDLGTHDNSIIEYDNNFIEDAEVKSNFDVDLVYSYNEGDTPCLVTTDDSGDVMETNPYLVPSLLHETFYFVNREFKEGTFNRNFVSLQLGLFEEATRELDGSYDLAEWDVEYSVKINPLTSNVTEQFAVVDEIKYSIDKNNYTLKLRTKN